LRELGFYLRPSGPGVVPFLRLPQSDGFQAANFGEPSQNHIR
jgi:hypothetical protein